MKKDTKWKVPALGLIGQDAIRESFEGDLHQLQELLQGAIKSAAELSGEDNWWPYVHAVFDDFIVVEAKDGRLLQYGYTIDGTSVSLKDPIEVQKTFTPVSEDGSAKMVEAATAFIEAKKDSSWRIRVIRAGLSGNGNYYPNAVLREAAPLFERARVFVKSDEEHIAGRGKDVRNLIGALDGVSFVEGTGADAGELHATLRLIEPDGAVATKLREAWSRGMSQLFGFSIDVAARARRATHAGRPIREAQKFLKVKSVDLIVDPGAGGGVIDLIEANKETVMDREEIIALLEAKGVLASKEDHAALSDTCLVTMLSEAVKPDTKPDSSLDRDGGDPAAEAMRQAVSLVEARQTMRERINASALPDKAKARLVERFSALERFTEAEVDQSISDEADYLSAFTESGHVRGLGDVAFGESRFEKVEHMLDAFFDRDNKHHRHAQSFKEAYITITGDRRVTGLMGNCDQALLRESLGSVSFDDVLGNAITRRMVKDYRAKTRYDVWRQLATTVPINDFRTQERTRFGGYGDLPKVAESAAYGALGSPSDEKASYMIAKRGGPERAN